MAVATKTKSKKPAPWTDAQITLLNQNIEQNPVKAEAFRETAKALKKKPSAVQQKYYEMQKGTKKPKAAPSSKAKPVQAVKPATVPSITTKAVTIGQARQMYVKALDREIKTLDNKLADLEAERAAIG